MSDMIPDPESYFRHMIPSRSPLLTSLEAQAEKEDIPIVGPLVGELLYILVRVTRAARVLELGTATGYSALFLAEACAATGGKLTTVEWDKEMARQAEANLKAAGLAAWADVQCASALEAMTRMTATFDVVFLDIEKEDYLPALPHCTRLVAPGGLLIADNVAFADAAPFNQAVRANPARRCVSLYALLPSHSPEMDALALAVRM